MRVHNALLALALSAASTQSPCALAVCRLDVLKTLPVTMRDGRALVSGQINGADGLLVPDAGAFYDLANGVIRLLRAHDCGSSVLAYWLKPGQFYSILDFSAATAQTPHISRSASVNGAAIRFMLEPGVPATILGARAAQAAAVRSDGTGTAVLASFKIGDEEIRNARLRVGELPVADSADMLLGADFLRSHRIYLSGSQGKLYFTHNGGSVFDPAPAP